MSEGENCPPGKLVRPGTGEATGLNGPTSLESRMTEGFAGLAVATYKQTLCQVRPSGSEELNLA